MAEKYLETDNQQYIQAVELVKSFKNEDSKVNVTNEGLLRLYALYKIANNEDVAKPGLFSGIESKYKFGEFDKVKNTGLTPKEAQDEYVEFAQELKEKGEEATIKKVEELKK